MGTWMSHIRIAELLLTQIEGLDPEMFAIGSIGPDSGLPDEKWESFDPPKKVSHFEYLDGSAECADLDFFRQHLMGVSANETLRFSFLLGYFFHLVTDNLWLDQIWRPHKNKHRDWYNRDQTEFAIETKRDWYGLDFVYLRNHPNSLFHRVFPGAEYSQNFLDFMSPKAFEHQLNYIKTFYQRTDEAVQALYTRPFHLLSQMQMDQFISAACDTLFGIYALILRDWQNIGNHRTSLDLISPFKP